MTTIRYAKLRSMGVSGRDMAETVDGMLKEAERLLEWDMERNLTKRQRLQLRQRLADAVAGFYFEAA